MSTSASPTPEWKQVLRARGYRLRLIIFVLLGLTIFLASALLEDHPSLRDAALEFGVAFSAVGLISFLWDFLGGDPIEHRLQSRLSDLDGHLDTVHRSLTASSDVVTLGVERMWPNRREWEHDPSDGLEVWKTRLCQAREINVVSITFWRWMRDGQFGEAFFDNLARGATAAIVIYHPSAPVSLRRAKDEKDRTGQKMKTEIESTLRSLAERRDHLAGKRKNLTVGLTTKFGHFAQIIRADDRILIASYLSGQTGAPSPTMQLRGVDTLYFAKYLEQIKIVRERSQPLHDADFADILNIKFPDVESTDDE